jgi:hypothetical protein
VQRLVTIAGHSDKHPAKGLIMNATTTIPLASITILVLSVLSALFLCLSQ